MTLIRHIAVRIWVSIFFWMLMIFWFFPILQTIVGIQWLLIPALLFFAAFFVLTGVIMDRIAFTKIDRFLEEARVYERAGMLAETEKALNAAVSLYDSFLLSPNSTRAYYDKLLARAAQHRLARGGSQIALDSWVLAYLERFPKDSEAAQIWLQAAMRLEQISSKHFDLITRLSQNQPDNMGFQHLLARIFLLERRADFEALQLYRRILAHEGDVDGNFLSDLAHLLATEGLSDEWAFEIYLQAYAESPTSAEILKGILACVRKIGLHERNRPLLMRARDLLSQSTKTYADSAEIEQTLLTLQSAKTIVDVETAKIKIPTEYEETLIPTQASATKLLPRKQRQRRSKPFDEIRGMVLHRVQMIKKSARRSIAAITASFKNVSMPALLRWVAVACICGGILFFIVNIVALLSQEGDAPEKEASIKGVVAKADPFALQVAAYSSQNEARKYMQKLKQQNLNAYLTEAEGRDKKWYQVRISHFTDPGEAKKLGEALKSKGVINDYYVANYKPPLEE